MKCKHCHPFTSNPFIPNWDFVGNVGTELTADVATFGNVLSLQQIRLELIFRNSCGLLKKIRVVQQKLSSVPQMMYLEP